MGDLCVGKFAPLKEYIGDLTLDDLRTVAVEDFVSYFRLEHRLLASIFWKQNIGEQAG